MSGILPYLYIAISLAAFLEAIFILANKPKRTANQAFFLFAVGAGIWIGGMGTLLLTQSFTFVHVLNCGGLLAVIGITWFAFSFPDRTSYPVPSLLFWAPLFLGGAFLICSREIIASVQFLPEWQMVVGHGIFMPAWAALLTAYVLAATMRIYRSFRVATKDDAARILLIYVGISIFLLFSIIFDVLLPALFSFTTLNALGPLSAIAFLGAVGYSLVADTFLDIRLVIQRGLVYTICFALLACLYALLLVLVDSLFIQVTHPAYSIVASITILIGVYTIPRIEAQFSRLTDSVFFKENYNYFRTFEELAEILDHNLDLRVLAKRCLSLLEKALKPKYAYFVQLDSIQCYAHEICTCKRVSHRDANGLQIPIRSGSELIGTFLLGGRKSGDKYTNEDMALLRTFEKTASVSFEKARLYEQLRRYSVELETEVEDGKTHLEVFRKQQEFFNDISHALKTPLTVLSGNLELLRSKHQVSAQYTSMYQAYSDISRLVQSILKISRVENQLAREACLFDLSEMVEQVVRYVQIIAEMEGIDVSLNTEPGCFTVGSKAQLEEAFTNILSNAIKYTSHCTPRRVRVSLTRGQILHELQVRDTGIGMTTEQVQQIFDRYYRVPRTDGREGHGLGMAITKRIIDQHRGIIAIESQPEVGTCVQVFIPASNSKVDQD